MNDKQLWKVILYKNEEGTEIETGRVLCDVTNPGNYSEEEEKFVREAMLKCSELRPQEMPEVIFRLIVA